HMDIHKKKMKASERELAEWLIDQYIAWRMGVLEEQKVNHLDAGIPDWKNIAARQIVSGQINRIIHENYHESIKKDVPVSWDNVVLTVLDHLKSDIRKYGHGGVTQ
ncbi:MAG: hypothetical protein Q9M17_03430, partial [Mariprofundus sp.]|nr:hypothetical protein [Mariprofundus sp.]